MRDIINHTQKFKSSRKQFPAKKLSLNAIHLQESTHYHFFVCFHLAKINMPALISLLQKERTTKKSSHYDNRIDSSTKCWKALFSVLRNHSDLDYNYIFDICKKKMFSPRSALKEIFKNESSLLFIIAIVLFSIKSTHKKFVSFPFSIVITTNSQ